MSYLKMKSLAEGYSKNDWISENEELAIFNAINNGEKHTNLARKYGCSTKTIKTIFNEQQFKKANKAMAKQMGSVELRCAGYLWSKGFSIARRRK
jgi:hypothetical protein